MTFYPKLSDGVGSKLIPRFRGPTPAIERTEVEKIRLAQKFLEKRKYVVLPELIGRDDVIDYLGCSLSHLNNLLKNTDFPRPFDINASKKSINISRSKPRWRITDVVNWIESRRV